MSTVLKLLAKKPATPIRTRRCVVSRVKRVQCDEIWSFVYAKGRNVSQRMNGEDGVGSQHQGREAHAGHGRGRR